MLNIVKEKNIKILPNKLNVNDLVGIVSPSKDITEDSLEVLNKGVKILNTFGLKAKFADNTGIDNAGKVLTPKEKGEDINQMFSDSSVKAVMCSRGGEGCYEVLPYINYDIVKSNPKMFTGFSDITHILNAIYAKTGLITFNASNIKTLGEDLGERMCIETINDFKNKLIDNNFGKYTHYTNWKCIRTGKAKGTLIGGNLYCFTNLLNTEYCPDFDDKILLIEELGLESSPLDIKDKLNKLDKMGAFKKIKGIWVGSYIHSLGEKIEDLVLEATKDYNFPILKCDDFGHTSVNVVIPIGAEVVMDADNLSVEVTSKILN